jgi:hypothetical protein
MPLVNQLCAALDERIEPHAMEAYTDYAKASSEPSHSVAAA